MMDSIGTHLNPEFGITSIPIMGFCLGHALRMSVRDVLAANFKKLRDATPRLKRPCDIVEAGAATNGTIGRISRKQSGPSVDTIEQLAAAYGIETWQMLVPTLQASPGKDGKPIITGLPTYEYGSAAAPTRTPAASDHEPLDWSLQAIEAAALVDELGADKEREMVVNVIRRVVLARKFPDHAK